MDYGLDLTEDTMHVTRHAFYNVSGSREQVFDLHSIAIQHDVFLDPLELIVCGTMLH